MRQIITNIISRLHNVAKEWEWPVVLYLLITVIVPWFAIFSYLLYIITPTLYLIWVKAVKFVLALLY